MKNTIEFTLPDWTLCPLFNDDNSGLEDEDIKKLVAFITCNKNKYGTFYAISATENEGDFKHTNDLDRLGGNCQIVTFCIKD